MASPPALRGCSRRATISDQTASGTKPTISLSRLASAYIVYATITWRAPASSLTPRADVRALPIAGSRIPISVAMMAITTSSSIRVNARSAGRVRSAVVSGRRSVMGREAPLQGRGALSRGGGESNGRESLEARLDAVETQSQ